MEQIKITKQFNETLAGIVAAGKTPWVIITEDYAVGAYPGRQTARDANAKFKIAGEKTGRVMLASDVKFEVIELGKPVLQVVPTLPISEVFGTKPGYSDHETVSAVFDVVLEAVKGSPEARQALQDAGLPVPPLPKTKIPMTRESTVERPCKRVWHIADEMKNAAGGVDKIRRKDVLARCVAEGIAFYTARTQYQLWLTIQNGGTI